MAIRKDSASSSQIQPSTTGPVRSKKLSKMELVRLLAEKMNVPNKQVVSFFDLLLQMAIEHTRQSGEFTVPGLGKLVKAERKERMDGIQRRAKQSGSRQRLT